uniref:Innexin n=1 Tax=Parascaris univalens TaxID=6257 RepID=A0A915B1U7_PARUN
MFFHATLARSFIQSLHLRGDDDFVDRLNYYYTPIMLAAACVIISAKQVLSDLLCGKPWTESGHFPRVTLCDFEVRYLANLNRYTVQCALLINIINEKVFAFFWCWYLVLMMLTSCSTLFWILNCTFMSEKAEYMLRFMRIAESADRSKERKISGHHMGGPFAVVVFAPYLVDKFVAEFLKSDGKETLLMKKYKIKVFTLRLIASHAGELVVVDVVRNLWKEFHDRNWREFEQLERSNDFRARAYDVKETLISYMSRKDSRGQLRPAGLAPPVLISQKVFSEIASGMQRHE